MKKRLLLALSAVLLLACVFAISVSAEVTTYDDAPERTKIQVSIDDVVVFDDGFCCPTGYVFKDQSTVGNGRWGSPSIAGAFDFTYINEKTGKDYKFENIVELDFPQGVTSLGTYMAHKATNLKRVSIPDSVTTLGGCVFQEASGLEECVFENGINSQIKEIPTYAFYGTAIKAISLPDSVTLIKGEAAFSACKQLTAIYLPSSLVEIQGGPQGKATFDNCNNMYFVNEPFTYDNIPEKPTVYYFPKNFSTISNQCIFRYCNNLNDVMVFSEAMTSIPNSYTFQGSSNSVAVFLGDMINVNAQYWLSVKTIYFANKADLSADNIETLTGSQAKYYCNAEGNTNHLAEKADVTNADCLNNEQRNEYCFCGASMGVKEVEGTALGHSHSIFVDVVYENYSADGYYSYKCERCNDINKDKVAKALFVCLGYSSKSYGSSGISVAFLAQKEIIAEYESVTGRAVKYGLFAVSQAKLGDNDVFAESGDVANGAITADISNREFAAFEIKVTGFTEEQKDTKLALGAYVAVTDENGTTYSYMQDSTRGELGAKYCFVSFNAIAENPENE